MNKNKRKKLKMLRLENNLTQKEMAEKLGRSRAAYIKIEHGERNASRDFWEKLQEVFAVPDADMWELQKGGDK